MSTLASLVVNLGLDATGYSKGLAGAADDASRFVDKSTGGFSAWSEIATGALRKVGELAVETAGVIVRALVDEAGQAVATAAAYESTSNIFEATARSVASSGTDMISTMSRMDTLAVELGNDIKLPGTSAADAAEAMTAMVQRGVSIEDTFDGVRGVLELSAAAQISNQRAAEITANALNTFSLAGSEAGRVADLLAATSLKSGASIENLAMSLKMSGAVASQLGIPIEEVTASLGQMAKQGLTGSDAGTSLKTMLMALVNPSNEAKNVMDQFGVSVFDATGKLKPLPDLLTEFTKISEGASITMRMSADDLEKIGKKAEDARDKIASLSEKNADLTSKMSELSQQIPKAIDAFNNKRIQAEEDYHDNLTDLIRSSQQRQEDLQQNYTEDTADRQTSHTDKLADIETDYQRKVAALQKRFDTATTDEQRAKIQEQINAAATAHQYALDDENTAYQRKEAAAKAHYDRQVETIKTNMERQNAAIDAAYQKQEARANQAFNTSMTDLATSISQRQSALQGDIDKNIGAMSTAQVALDGFNQTLATHGEHIEIVTQKMEAEARATIFGSDGIRAANILIEQSGAVHETMVAGITKGGEAAQLAEARMRGYTGSQEAFTSTLQTLEQQAGKPMLEPLKQGYELLNKAIGDVSPAIVAFSKDTLAPAMEMIVAFGNAFRDSPDKVAFLNDAVTKAYNGVIQYINDHKEEWGNAALEWLTMAGDYAEGKIVELTPKVVSGLLSMLPAIITAGGDLAIGAINWLAGEQPKVTANTNTLFDKIRVAFEENLPKISDAAGSVVGRLGTALVEKGIPALGVAVVELIAAFGRLLIEKGNAAREPGTYGAVVIDNIRAVFNIENISVAVVELIASFGRLLIDKANAAREPGTYGAMIIDGIRAAFTDAPTALYNAGADVIQGFFDGIYAKWNELIGGLTGLWDQLPQSVRDALQMHSPSRVLLDLGEQAGGSVASGVANMTGMLYAAGYAIGDTVASGATNSMAGVDLSGMLAAAGLSSSTANAGVANSIPISDMGSYMSDMYAPGTFAPAMHGVGSTTVVGQPYPTGVAPIAAGQATPRATNAAVQPRAAASGGDGGGDTYNFYIDGNVITKTEFFNEVRDWIARKNKDTRQS